MGNTSARPLRLPSPLVLRAAWNSARGVQRARLALVLVALAVAARVLQKKRVLPRAYAALAADQPRLVYSETAENRQLLALCPALTRRKYCPPWFLLSGHVQTLHLARANDMYASPEIPYVRELVELPDGGVVSLDWAPVPSPTSKDAPTVDRTRRTVLILPGLTGGSPEFYIRKSVHRLNARGWQCVVLNARGCANTPVRTAQLFSSAYTQDLRFVARRLAETFDFETFIGLGFSMGANVLTKFLGEEQDATPLEAGIAVGNPFDLEICSNNFGGSLFNRLTYDKVLTGNLKNLFFERSNAHEMFQGYPGVDVEAVRSAQTVREFDDRLTKIAFRYNTVEDYYHDASSKSRLPGVRVPLLCVSAADDPISIERALPTRETVEQNPNVILCVTHGGGHLGFFEDPEVAVESKEDPSASENEDKTPSMWFVPAIADFADAVWTSKHGTKLVHESTSGAASSGETAVIAN